MKCANCNREALPHEADSCGEIFVPTKTDFDFDVGGIMRSAKITHTHTGIRINWFVCDACAAAGRDLHLKKFYFSIAFLCLGLFVLPLGPEYPGRLFLIIGSVGSLLFGCMNLMWAWQSKEYKTKFCRYRILKRCFHKLKNRDDFIAKYGTIKPSADPMSM